MSFVLTNALDTFMSLMNEVLKPFSDSFIIVFTDDILVYSKNKEKNEANLCNVLKLLKREQLYDRYSKC